MGSVVVGSVAVGSIFEGPVVVVSVVVWIVSKNLSYFLAFSGAFLAFLGPLKDAGCYLSLKLTFWGRPFWRF